jgi:hypothetical protein
MLQPVAVQGGLALTQLSAGDVQHLWEHSRCGPLLGLNPCGQGGDGTTMARPVPTLVAGLE